MQDTMDERPKVDALMDAGLGDWLAAQQALRDETKKKADSRTYVGFGGAALAVFLGIMFTWPFQWILGLGGMSVVGGLAWAAWIRKPVELAIKSEMNVHIAKAIGFTYSVGGEAGRVFELACAFDLLPSHDENENEFEDFWFGTLDGIPMSLFEVHLQEWRGSGKNRRKETVFRGPLMVVDFTREFAGTTLIERDGARFKLFAGDTITLNELSLDRAKMVHPDFEAAFDVWTTDQVEARYLVHPAYSERLIALEQQFRGQSLRALFHRGQIIVAVETDRLFESGSLDSDRDRALMQETIDQFSSLADMAKALNERARS